MTDLTLQTLLELAGHEGGVCECYKDSVGVWTFGIGMTNASGHTVYPRYKDNPQTPEKVLELYEWVVKEKYLPAVLKAFKPLGRPLTETELAGALSFHYNTGAIGRATWVKQFCAGDVVAAKKSIMNWKKPPEIQTRRRKERDLVFDGKWSNKGGTVTFYPINKKTYKPIWSKAYKVAIKPVAPAPEPPKPPTLEPPAFPPTEDLPKDGDKKLKVVVKVVAAAIAAVIAILAGLLDWLKSLF